jgi:hypothetical protein
MEDSTTSPALTENLLETMAGSTLPIFTKLVEALTLLY